MMEKKYLPVLAFALIIGAATVLAGCAESIAYNDSYTITHTDAEFPLHVTSNDYMVGDRALVSLYGGQPACGHVRGTPTYSGSPATVRSNPPFIFSRSSGVAAGAYRFQYMLSVSTYDYPIVGGSYENSTATVTLILTETYPSPDGSPECASPYQAFINSASYSGGVVTVQWQVPEGVQYADSYEIAIYNGEPNSGHEFLTNQNLRNPRNHSPQTSNLRPSARPTLFWVVLITKLNYREVFRDTLRGVQGEPPGFILVDDHVRLIKGSVERATVDVLANDTDLRPNAGT
ncbi:MAG: hypothetical protein OEZ32_13305, partial [Nitrospinota bacterium]|nr:hypothetical protein [Nitrospinota bacterium]